MKIVISMNCMHLPGICGHCTEIQLCSYVNQLLIMVYINWFVNTVLVLLSVGCCSCLPGYACHLLVHDTNICILLWSWYSTAMDGAIRATITRSSGVGSGTSRAGERCPVVGGRRCNSSGFPTFRVQRVIKVVVFLVKLTILMNTSYHCVCVRVCVCACVRACVHVCVCAYVRVLHEAAWLSLRVLYAPLN